MSADKNDAPHEHETHHVYDGIREDDHPLPVWWLGTFFVTIGFSLGYWFWYHSVEAGKSLAQAYAAEVESLPKATAFTAMSDDVIAALERDQEAIARGKEAYVQNCVACHLAQGQGSIGPNLTDPYWIHGGDARSVMTTISQGVAAKGMPAWGALLGEKKVIDLYAFVNALRNTNVAGKAPQGVDDKGSAAPGP
jgi:cytochrome c oxidase cbb3-type subunit 3